MKFREVINVIFLYSPVPWPRHVLLGWPFGPADRSRYSTTAGHPALPGLAVNKKDGLGITKKHFIATLH